MIFLNTLLLKHIGTEEHIVCWKSNTYVFYVPMCYKKK